MKRKRKENEDYPIPAQDLITDELVEDISITRNALLIFGEKRGKAIVEKTDSLLADEPALLPFIITFRQFVLSKVGLPDTTPCPRPRKKAEQQEQEREELVTLLSASSLGCLFTWKGGNRIAERMQEIMDDNLFTFFYELAETIRVREIARRCDIS